MISEAEIRAINRRLTLKIAELREEVKLTDRYRRERDEARALLAQAHQELLELLEGGARSDDMRLASMIARQWTQALKDSGGRYREAARRLGIDPSTLWRWRHGRTRWARQETPCEPQP